MTESRANTRIPFSLNIRLQNLSFLKELVRRYCHDLLTATGGIQVKAGAGAGAVADHTSARNLSTTSSAGNVQMISGEGGEDRLKATPKWKVEDRKEC